jgi:putative endonuclease
MIETDSTFFTYIVRCKDGTLYTGWTVDLEQRIAAHNQGKGAKYTRNRGPVELLATWTSPSKSEAMKLEYSIKQMSRHEKQILIMEYAANSRKKANA